MLFFAYARELGRFFLPAPPKLQIMSLYLTTKIAQAVYLQENIFIFSLNFYPLIALHCPAFSNHLCRCSLQSFQHGGQFSVKKSILEIVSCVHSITDLLFCWPKEEELQLIFLNKIFPFVWTGNSPSHTCFNAAVDMYFFLSVSPLF